MALYEITPQPEKKLACPYCKQKQPTLYVVSKTASEKEHDKYSRVGGFMICSVC
jgi:hypothetical protein